MSGLGLLVTASERAVSKDAASAATSIMEPSTSPRGSKRVTDDQLTASLDRAPACKYESHGSLGHEAALGNDRDRNAKGDEKEEDGDAAARRGDLESCKRDEARNSKGPVVCLSYLAKSFSRFRSGLTFTKRAMEGASSAGHLEMVQWLHAQEVDCSTDAMDLAAEGGHLDVVKWLHENRTEGCSASALALAAGRGHLETVQWFYEKNIPGDISKAIDQANEGGHVEVVDWLKSHSSNKKPRVEGRGGNAVAAAGSSPLPRPAGAHPQAMVPPPSPASKSPCHTMGMFGSPFGNFSPVNGIVLSGPTTQAFVPKQAATGVIPASSGSVGGAPQRLRSQMLRSPELTLATSGRLSANDERQLKAVMEFRKAYSAQALEGSNVPKDPFTLFAVWFEEARIARASEPGAMCLSTVGPTGRPSARYVMLQGFDKRGFVWYTNFESRKAQEMSHNPYGALSFWWSEVQRAVRIEGVVCKVSEKESTEYFQSRPRGSQVGAWALHQSRPVESRGSLEANVKDVQNKFSSIRDVPRPPHFGGFRLRPDRIEFWKGRQTRIHDRIVYVIMDDKWIMQRLQP